ncbi:MAG: nuclear transport factor 2 family protein [Candidatus Thorarchaeota archaeon]
MSKPREERRSAVREFIECINAGDAEDLMMHQTKDFTFIDYDGDVTTGRDDWYSYFENYPEYKIHIDHLLDGGNGVAIIGRTTGCHVGPKVEKNWTILWIAQVRGDLIAEWRIYSNVHEIREKGNIGERTKEYMEKLDRVKSTALKFVEAINAGDVGGFMALQTEDFMFMDNEGEVSKGRSGWNDYFTAYPNNKIHVNHIITSGNGIAILGRTTGSQVAREFEDRETILWTAEIRGDLVSEWRLYADIKDIESGIQSGKKRALKER